MGVAAPWALVGGWGPRSPQKFGQGSKFYKKITQVTSDHLDRNTRTDFQYFTWGVWTNHGGCNLFPDIGLLARRNFAHTIQDLL